MAKVRRATDLSSNRLDKQAEREKRSLVYSTAKIKEILADKSGHQDLNPFWHGLFDYREAGIAFDYTDEELLELDKCSMDCLYFAEHYAKFKNDKGLTLVKLRDYQKRLLKLFGEEVYNEEKDIIMPKNLKLCLLQSRLTGKCVDIRSTVKIPVYSQNMYKYIYLNNENYSITKYIWEKLKKNVQYVIKNLLGHPIKSIVH